MKRVRTALLCILLLVCQVAGAQTSEEIKRDTSFIWAEGYGINADNEALETLSMKIGGYVKFYCPREAVPRLMETYDADVKAVSRRLTSSYSTIRYIRKPDVYLIFERRWKKADELTEYADLAYATDLGLALCYYKWALAYRRSVPDKDPFIKDRIIYCISKIEKLGVKPRKPDHRLPNIENEVAAISRALGDFSGGGA